MKNIILNITANGSWQVLNESNNFPHNVQALKIQARGSNDVEYRYVGQTAHYTVKNGDGPAILNGKFDPDEIEVRATSSVVIEVECGTGARADFS